MPEIGYGWGNGVTVMVFEEGRGTCNIALKAVNTTGEVQLLPKLYQI